MIDLSKLEEKFRVLFEEETELTFKKWLLEKKGINLDSFLGEGIYFLANNEEIDDASLVCAANIIYSSENINAGNTQYAMAA